MLYRLRHTRGAGVGLLLDGAAVTVLLGAVAALLAWQLSGADAGNGVLVGTALVVLVCTGGAVVVTAVTRIAPTASLLVALMTYTLQVALLLVAFVVLERSGLLESRLDREWLGGAVIGATMLWLAAQVGSVLRVRVPTYDLASEAGER